jgi:hypothetical protein
MTEEEADTILIGLEAEGLLYQAGVRSIIDANGDIQLETIWDLTPRGKLEAQRLLHESAPPQDEWQ